MAEAARVGGARSKTNERSSYGETWPIREGAFVQLSPREKSGQIAARRQASFGGPVRDREKMTARTVYGACASHTAPNLRRHPTPRASEQTQQELRDECRQVKRVHYTDERCF